MPYIHPVLRNDETFSTPGDLNYHITRLLCRYVTEQGLSYRTLNDVVGALECAKQEFYRRVVIPYEDHKIIENGDVYPDEITKIRTSPSAQH